MSSIIFTQPRVLENASKIPFLGWEDRINLVRTASASYAGIRAGGAKGGIEKGWYIERDDKVLLDPLDPFLPHIARKSIIPNVVDLIPETSWCSSLANMLATRSWRLVRDVVIDRAGGCEDCGHREKLECHEIWSYDEDSGVQKLEGLRSVCSECHETYHLGYASVRDRYDVAFRRLVTINRILKHEEAEFEEEIFSKFLRRSELEWSLDLSLLAGQKLNLKASFSEVAPGVLIGEGHRGEVEVSVEGVEIVDTGKGLLFS